MKTECWAVFSPSGKVLADSEFRDEAMAWKIVLGWPDQQEIEDAKAKGYRCVRVTVEEVK